MNANLILHCGAAAVARESLSQVKTPARTQSWQPIPHADLVDQVERALQSANMRIVEQAHGLTAEGNRYFGLLQVANCQASADDYAYIVGLRNSHDKSFPAGLVVGSQVFVCDNLSFSGEIRIARKHTTHIMRDLPRLTSNAVGLLAEKWTAMSERISRYKVSELSDKEAHDFIIRAVDAGATPLNQVPVILNEWRTPRHPEFAEGGKTAWRLFNGFTESYKGTNLNLISKRAVTLHGLMDAHVGLLN